MRSTLVLNADATPVSVIPLSTLDWQDAIKVVIKERANVLEQYNRWIVRSPSVSLQMPSVIMLTDYQDRDGNVEFSRHNIYMRDNYVCQYCAKKFQQDELTFDHVIPRRDGGKTVFDNILTACQNCNQEKGHEYRKAIRKPFIPSYWDLAKNCRKMAITIPHESWINYLNWDGEIIIDENLRHINTEDPADEYDFDELLM